MIFIILGSQQFQFNRLLEAADKLSGEEEIFAQTGYSDYIPQNYAYKKFLDKNEFEEMVNKSDIVITHGGTGTIINAIKKGKKVIAVPRLAGYGEHVDDHQIELLKQFQKMQFIFYCEDMNLKQALETVRKTEYKQYQSNTVCLIADIERFINE